MLAESSYSDTGLVPITEEITEYNEYLIKIFTAIDT